jgi:hypothetical protein
VSADPTTGIHLFEFYCAKWVNFSDHLKSFMQETQRIPVRAYASPDKSIGKKMTSVAIYVHKLTFLLVLIQPPHSLHCLGIRWSLLFAAGHILSPYRLAKLLDNFLRTPRMGQTNSVICALREPGYGQGMSSIRSYDEDRQCNRPRYFLAISSQSGYEDEVRNPNGMYISMNASTLYFPPSFLGTVQTLIWIYAA